MADITVLPEGESIKECWTCGKLKPRSLERVMSRSLKHYIWMCRACLRQCLAHDPSLPTTDPKGPWSSLQKKGSGISRLS